MDIVYILCQNGEILAASTVIDTIKSVAREEAEDNPDDEFSVTLWRRGKADSTWHGLEAIESIS